MSGSPFVRQFHLISGAVLPAAQPLPITQRRHVLSNGGIPVNISDISVGAVKAGDRVTLVLQAAANPVILTIGGAADTRINVMYSSRVELLTAGDEVTLEYGGATVGWTVVSTCLEADVVADVDAVAALPVLGNKMRFTSRTADPTTVTGGQPGRRIVFSHDGIAAAITWTHNDAQDGVLTPDGRPLRMALASDVLVLEHNSLTGADSRWFVTSFNLGLEFNGSGTDSNPFRVRCQYARHPFTDIQIAGLTNDLNVGAVLPAGAHVLDMFAVVAELLAGGGGLNALQISCGINNAARNQFRAISANVWAYAAGTKVYGALGAATWVDGGGAQIQVRYTGNVNLSNLTDGTVDAYVFYVVLPVVP